MNIEDIKIAKWTHPSGVRKVYRVINKKENIGIQFHITRNKISDIKITFNNSFFLSEKDIDVFEFVFNKELINLLFFSNNDKIDNLLKKRPYDIVSIFKEFKELFKEYV